MPFRRAIFDAAISVSALQWLAAEDALRCFQSLREVLVRDARAVFQEPPPEPARIRVIARRLHGARPSSAG
jgi:cyclopropane fatty-acyl-phospholipid synthase-like methyltransferase